MYKGGGTWSMDVELEGCDLETPPNIVSGRCVEGVSRSSSKVVSVLARTGCVAGGLGKPKACGDVMPSLGTAVPIFGFSGRSLEDRFRCFGEVGRAVSADKASPIVSACMLLRENMLGEVDGPLGGTCGGILAARPLGVPPGPYTIVLLSIGPRNP